MVPLLLRNAYGSPFRGGFGLILQERGHMVGVAPAFVFALWPTACFRKCGANIRGNVFAILTPRRWI
jgi:hypothetical protein